MTRDLLIVQDSITVSESAFNMGRQDNQQTRDLYSRCEHSCVQEIDSRWRRDNKA